jgi:ferritin-like metal-binding protein YciE
MRMDNLNDLFLHGLKDIYDAEHRLVKALGQLAKEARDPEISGLFEDHRAETEEQTGRLEECFELTGAKPRKHACTGMMGILEEQKSFTDEKPAKEMLAAFDMGAALRTEHYEIAT